LTFSVTVQDVGGASETESRSFDVIDPSVVGQGDFTFTATEAIPASTQTVATFTDPGNDLNDPEPLSDYGASIDWGDGTSATTGTISYNSSTGVFTVTGDHTYSEESEEQPQHKYAIVVTVTHAAAAPRTITSWANVADQALTSGEGVPI